MNVAAILKAKGTRVLTVSRDATLRSVAQVLADKKIGAVVVVGDNNSVVGICSERDIIRAVAAEGGACLDRRVSSAMTSTVVTCTDSDTVDRVMQMMTDGRFRHVPVVNDEGLVGIVSIGDVVKHHIAEVEMEATALKTYLVAG